MPPANQSMLSEIPSPAPAFAPPLVLVAAGLAGGIMLDNALGCPPALAALGAVVAAGLTLVRGVRRRMGIALTVLAAAGAGAVRHHVANNTVASDHIVHYTRAEPALGRVRGVVISRPTVRTTGYAPFEPWLYRQTRTSFLLAVEAIETNQGLTPAQGKLRVAVKTPVPAVREGSRIEAFGWLYRPPGPRNPGAVDWALFNRRHGLHAGLTCDSANCVRICAAPAQAGWLERARQAIRRMLHDSRLEVGDEHVGMLDAMILGRRSGMERELERAFINTGCAHYLAVSGVHVGMLALAIGWPARMLGATRRRTALAVTLAVTAYALLADPRPPILRAAVMTATLSLAWSTRRRASVVGALSLAAVMILLVNPTALFDVGFQLSFVTVAGVVALSPVVSAGVSAAGRALAGRLRREKATTDEIERIAALHAPAHAGRKWIGQILLGALSVSLAAWVSSLPLTAANFERVALWGWFNSLATFPLVFLVMVLGFLKIATTALLPPIAPLVDAALDGAARLLLEFLHMLPIAPQARGVIPAPPEWAILVYYLALAAWVIRVRGHGPRWVGALAVLAMGAALAGWIGRDVPNGLRLTQFAVGRGTSTLIETPDGRAWLYDAGASGSFDPGADVILPCLRERGIRRIDGVIISHANLDHFGGLPSIIDALPCGPVYLAPQFAMHASSGTPGAALGAVLTERRHTVSSLVAGDVLHLGEGVSAEVLWPPPDAPPELNVNDCSLVVRLSYANRAVLLTGDIGHAAQAALLRDSASYARLPADVLVLPHHGAVEGNTAAFIDTVGAPDLLRSTFERVETSGALMALTVGRRVHSTADAGALEVLIGGSGVRVSAFCPARAGDGSNGDAIGARDATP